MTIKQIIRAVEQSKNRIAKERNKLRELITEAEHLYENCESAEDSLVRAADSLSELV
jgi:ABC-type transporter Mla subunit MlaD